MRKTILILAIVGTAVACASPTSPSHKTPQPLLWDGIPCTTEDGRSGYLISAGRDFVCQAN